MSLEVIAGADPGALAEEQHVVQFYDDEAFLAESVARFVGTGIGAGDSVVVIATASHQAAFCERLRSRSIDVERACQTGRLTFLDAHEQLARFMDGDRPDRDRFRAIVGGLLDDARARRPSHAIRAFGEMVDVLWRAGNRQGALQLEALWNELGRSHSFTLLCAYAMNHFYRESEDELRLRDFMDSAVIPIHCVGEDGIVLWANQAALDLLGYSREELVGRPIADVHVDAVVIEDMLARLARQETLREYPARLRKKDGSIRHVLIDSNAFVEDGQFVHTRCFTRDITARLESEEMSRRNDRLMRDLEIQQSAEGKLRESETRMRLLIDSIRDYAIFMLDAQGKVASWNPGAQRIKGYLASEIIGRHFSTFYEEAEVKAGKCEIELRVAAETGRFEDEGWRVRKDGSRFWANVIISAVHDDENRLIGFAKVTRDLTERRRAEDERAARQVAEQANRAKDEFLAMLGHELRNPLAPIITAIQLMKLRGGPRSNEQLVIERQVQHVVRLVDDLLDVSRITQGKVQLKKESFELAEVVAKAVEIASPLLEQRQHRFTVEVPREGMRLHADPMRLSQVLANLLTNAAKYTDYDGEIALAAWRDGHEIVVQVKDNGVGISAELLPRIFDLFVQAPRSSDRREGGLGIGLTLVRSLVQMHGGTVAALSDGLGRGSAFVVRLPGAIPQAVPDAEKRASRPHKSATSRRILVVDDNEDALTLLGELLRTMGHEVETAGDGPQALAALERFAPEVAVLDIGLPVMDGYELAQKLRERIGDGCRMIALTGYGQDHDRARSHTAGFEAHLVKPVVPTQLLRLIDGE